MAANSSSIHMTAMADVLDLPILEDIPPLTASDTYIGNGCLSRIQVPTASDTNRDDRVLVSTPSYPALWDVKDNPYAAHILDPGTEEPDNLHLRDPPSAELSFQSTPSSHPREFCTLDQAASSVEGPDSSSGTTPKLKHVFDGQEHTVGALGSELVRAGAHGTQGSGSSTDFMSLFSIPDVLVALDETTGDQQVEDNNWSAFSAPLPVDMGFATKREPQLDDNQTSGPVDFPARLPPNAAPRVVGVRGRGRRVTHLGRAAGRAGHGRSTAGGQAIDPALSPEEAKRIRRMLSNRESARRSRHRKQAHLLDLENQVSQLAVEKEQLEEHLHQMAERVRAVDDENGCLRQQVRQLKAKVLKLASAIREGPIMELEGLKEDDEGSSTGMEAKLGCYDQTLLRNDHDMTEAFTARQHRIRTNRTGSLERNSKRHSF